MLKNTKGNVMIATPAGVGHVSVAIHKSEASLASFLDKPDSENQPENLTMHIGAKLDDAKEEETNLDSMNMADKEVKMLELILVDLMDENFKVLQRTKFEISSWKII